MTMTDKEVMTIKRAQELMVAINRIDIGDRRRKPDLNVIDGLVKDLAEHGLLQRIGLRERHDGRHDLVWGRNRFEAAAKLGWTMIEAKVYPPETPDELLKVLEIVENLKRQELTVEERHEQITLLGAAIKEAEPTARSNSDLHVVKPHGHVQQKGIIRQVADQLGKDPSAVRQDMRKAGEAIGEPVDLERDSPAELRRKAEARRTVPERSAPRATSSRTDRFCKLYHAMDPRERNWAARWILKLELERTSPETALGRRLDDLLKSLGTFHQPDMADVRANTRPDGILGMSWDQAVETAAPVEPDSE